MYYEDNKNDSIDFNDEEVKDDVIGVALLLTALSIFWFVIGVVIGWLVWR